MTPDPSSSLVERVAIAISGAPFPSEASKRKARAAIRVVVEACAEVCENTSKSWGNTTGVAIDGAAIRIRHLIPKDAP